MVKTNQALHSAARTDIGLKRQINQDHWDSRVPTPDEPGAERGALFVIADGVGSLDRGEIASKLAVEALIDTYYQVDDYGTLYQLVDSAVQSAHVAVREHMQANSLRMGSTIAGLAIAPSGEAIMFNVGDTRIYRIRKTGAEAELEQLSLDQISVADTGLLSDEFERRNTKISSFLGQSKALQPAYRRISTQPGDTFIICTDGLWSLVPARQIKETVEKYPLERAVDELIDLAHSQGASDNVTVVLVRIGNNPISRSRSKRWIVLVAILLLLFVIGGTVLAMSRGWLVGAFNNAQTALPTTPEVAALITSAPTSTPTTDHTATANAQETIQAVTATTEAQSIIETAKSIMTATINSQMTANAFGTTNAQTVTASAMTATAVAQSTLEALSAQNAQVTSSAQTATANAIGTQNAQATSSAQTATANAISTQNAQATSSAQTATANAISTQNAQTTATAQTAATAVQLTNEAISTMTATAASMEETNSLATQNAQTTDTFETASAEAAIAAAITPTQTLNPTLITWTPTWTLTPSPTLEASVTLTSTWTLTPTPTIGAESTFTVNTEAEGHLYTSQPSLSTADATAVFTQLQPGTTLKALDAPSNQPGIGLVVMVEVIDGYSSNVKGWLILATPAPRIVVVAEKGALLRTGDDSIYPRVPGGGLLFQDSAEIIGINPENRGLYRWYQIRTDDDRVGWISGQVVDVQGDISNIPIIIPPTLPKTPTLTLTPTPDAVPTAG